METFLLIHGNRHGKWAWSRLSRQLEQAGHRVFAVDLPGHGDDATPRTALTLNDYVKFLVDFVLEQDLRNLVVVGHSAAGASIAAALEQLEGRIKRIVFVAALIPVGDESLLDFIPEERRATYGKIAHEHEEFCVPISWEQARVRYFEDQSEEEAREFFQKLTPEPFAAITSKVGSEAILKSEIPMTYVLCSRDQSLEREVCEKCARRIGAELRTIDAGHNAMLSHPEELAAILLAA